MIGFPVLCLFYICIFSITDGITRTVSAVNISGINEKRYSLKCYLSSCKGLKKVGACVQCAARGCTTPIHPRCAFLPESGFTESDELDEDGDLKLELFCPLHTKKRAEKNLVGKTPSKKPQTNNDFGDYDGSEMSKGDGHIKPAHGKKIAGLNKNKAMVERFGGCIGNQRVYQYEASYPYALLATHPTTIEASEAAGCEKVDVYNCCMSRLDTAGGFDWTLEKNQSKKKPLEQYGACRYTLYIFLDIYIYLLMCFL